ncbi:MAG: hypothetical protein RR387_07530, partial [Clostridiales bacterium]
AVLVNRKAAGESGDTPVNPKAYQRKKTQQGCDDDPAASFFRFFLLASAFSLIRISIFDQLD